MLKRRQSKFVRKTKKNSAGTRVFFYTSTLNITKATLSRQSSALFLVLIITLKKETWFYYQNKSWGLTNLQKGKKALIEICPKKLSRLIIRKIGFSKYCRVAEFITIKTYKKSKISTENKGFNYRTASLYNLQAKQRKGQVTQKQIVEQSSENLIKSNLNLCQHYSTICKFQSQKVQYYCIVLSLTIMQNTIFKSTKRGSKASILKKHIVEQGKLFKIYHSVM